MSEAAREPPVAKAASRAVDSGISWVFLLLASMSAAGLVWLAYDPSPPRWLVFVTVSLGWLVAVCLHEFGHALVAHAGGDDMIAERGYLTLNPVRYLHPLFSIVLPMLFVIWGGIGLPGAAVFVRTAKLRSRAWVSATALAGPLASFLVLLLLAAPFVILQPQDHQSPFWASLAFLAFLQATAVVLNLLPVPGLDGFAVLAPWLPKPLVNSIGRLRLIIMTGFILVVFTQPDALDQMFRAALALTDLLSIERYWIGDGLGFYHFWRQ